MLGVVRTLFVAPRTGDLVAVLIETPIVLLASWFAARLSARRFSVPPHVPDRLAMGLAAFTLLMTVETVLGVMLFARPLPQQFAAYGTPAGTIGLLGQLAFGLIPLLAARRR
jgi:hypothetical protein